MPSIIPALEVQTNLEKLASAAKTINELSDQLTHEVSQIEGAVNEFNLGIETNVRIESWASEQGNSGLWRLAYGKMAGKWGFFVEYLSEWPERGPDAETYESWLFKDSPREQRLKAVEKIPDLLAALVKKSGELAETVTRKVNYARDLSGTIRKKGNKATASFTIHVAPAEK
jgi:hypothetical protein